MVRSPVVAGRAVYPGAAGRAVVSANGGSAADLALSIFSLGLVLALLLVPIRADMMGYPLFAFLVPFDLFTLLSCSYYDLCVVGGATTMAALSVWAFRNQQGPRRVVHRLYVAWAVVALVFGLVNHEAVGMIGAPVNYQWIYYSDFLTSLDARNAIAEAVTVWVVLGFAIAIAGLLCGSRLLRRGILAARARSRLGRNTVRAATLVAVGYFGFMTWWMWGSSQYFKQANPMVALIASCFADEKPSIFTMQTDIGTAGIAINVEREVEPIAATYDGIRNVIFFVLESVPAEYIETYGGKYPVTPVIAKNRGRSRTFTSAYCHAPTTNKSIVSLFCSVYPWVSYHALTMEHPDNELVSLAAILGGRGYRTGFFNSGDIRYQGAGVFLKGLEFQTVQDHRTRKTDLAGFKDPQWEEMDSSDDLATTNSLLEWIRKKPDTPFLAVVWTMGTHYPYFYHGEEVDYGAKRRGLNRYLNALRHGDACLGKVLDTLDELHLTDSTLVVVLGDHGEAFGRHRQWAHATHIYEENVHIPLIFMHPRLFKGEQSSRVCGMIDLAPTVLDILGLPHPGVWQGRSLLRPTDRQRIYFFAPWTRMLFGFREGDRKYIYDARLDRSRVYDLAADPFEKKSILLDLSPGAEDMIKRKLAAWVQYQAKLMRERIVPTPAGN